MSGLRPLWLAVWGLWALAVLGGNDVDVVLAHWVAHAVVIGGLVSASIAVERWTTRGADVLRLSALAIAANACTAPLAYTAIRTQVPMRDQALAAFDEALGLGLPNVRAVLLSVPEVWWWQVYDLLVPLLAGTVVVLALLRPARARRFVAAYLLSFVIALPVITLVQAVGPWQVYGFEVSPTQAEYVRELATLKAPGAFRFDPTRTTGVVTFPSFHALLALLAAWGLAPVRFIGPVGVCVGAGIVLATLATGWHYAADVLGGAAICAAAVVLSGRLMPEPADT